MDAEFYRGRGSDEYFFHSKSRSRSDRYNDLGGTEDKNAYIFYNGSEHSNTNGMDGGVDRNLEKTAENKSHDPAKDSASVQSFDSTGKRKTFRRLITRFAEKTSMVGVPYISNAKFWWARLIWSFMLLVAIVAMSFHLWYLVDQYTDWPVQTKISLGFETLKFPEVTICNTNVMHKGRLDKYSGADDLKDLVKDLQPKNLVPDQFNVNYNPYATTTPPNGQQDSGSSATNQGQGDGSSHTIPKLGGSFPTHQGQGDGSTSTTTKLGGSFPTHQGQGDGSTPTFQKVGGSFPTHQGQGTGSTSTIPKLGGSFPTHQGQGQGDGSTPKVPTLGGSFPTQQGQSGSQGSQKPAKRRKRFVNLYKNFNKTRYDEMELPNIRNVMPQEKDDFDGMVGAKTELDDIFTRLYMDIDRKDRAQLGHNITDMLISCTFNGRECPASMFTLHQTSEYGNCWSISSKKFNVKYSGPSGGLTLVLNLEVTEYLKGITTGYGARVQIHEQRTYPSPAEEGLYIPASMETDIGLRMISIERQSGLYGDCDDGRTLQKSTNFKYSRSACQSFCVISTVMEKCKCFDEKSEEFADRKNNKLKPCRSRAEILCMGDIQKQFEAQKVSCNCVNPCSEVQYIKSVSQRQWPADDYAMVLLQGICDKYPDACASMRLGILFNPVKLSNNFLKLNIYYEDLNYENITEVPEIELQQFLSDVGGAIGLWIGLSILSLCELVQLFVELCDYGIHKTVKGGRQERKKRRKARKKLGNVTDQSFASKNERDWTNKHSRNDQEIKKNDFYLTPDQHSTNYTDSSHPGSDVMYDKPYRAYAKNHHYPNGRHH